MPDPKPTFSIVMPTYNRADRISSAIQSVLAQTYGDLELVISNGGSTDTTRDVVASFDDSRIKYLESKTKLTIGENYQCGYNAATGEYITFLSDDDAFLPSMLARVNETFTKEQASVVVFRSCYFYESLVNRALAGQIYIPKSRRTLRRFSSLEAATGILQHFGLKSGRVPDGFNVSYLANAVYKRSIFESIARHKRNLFEDTPADIYLALAVALTVDYYHCLDEPLHVWTEHGENATATAERKREELKSHYQRLLKNGKLEHVPIDLALPINCTYNALIAAAVDSDCDLTPEWTQYYISIYKSLRDWGSYGVDVTAELALWRSTLAKEEEWIRTTVNRSIHSPENRTKEILIGFCPKSYRRIRRLISEHRIDAEFRGTVDGVNDPYSCARFVENRITVWGE